MGARVSTLAVDFDGVIHAYSKGWHDGSIYDQPLPGALDGLRVLMEHNAVFIFTTRDRHQVTDWLIAHGFDAIADSPISERTFWNERNRLLVTNRKLAATAYLDDRAVRFVNWEQALRALAPAVEQRPAERGDNGKYNRKPDFLVELEEYDGERSQEDLQAKEDQMRQRLRDIQFLLGGGEK